LLVIVLLPERAEETAARSGIFRCSFVGIREGKLKLNDLVTHRYSLDQINTAVDDLEHGRILGRGILTYA
jgi:threonine dehydrogenase-like Zn-dependent dehydrogenase